MKKKRKGSSSAKAGAGRKPGTTRIRDSAQEGQTGPAAALGIRKQPSQQRSREMVEAILEAAAELFANQGYARTTTNKIADRAGVSVGSLYQYFPNKDSLLAELLALHHADVHQVVVRAVQLLADPDTPFKEGLRSFLEELVALHQANPTLTRSLSATVLRESPAVELMHKRNEDADRLEHTAALLAQRPEVRDGDHLAMAAVIGQSITQLTRWMVHDTPTGVDPSSLLDEVVELLWRFVAR